MRIIKMILDWCKNYANDYNTFNFDISKTKLAYSHTLPSNDTDMVTAITNLQNSRMANPEVLLQNLSFIDNVHEYEKGMDKWNEKVDNAKRLVNNKDNSGKNDTNVERHNKAKPLSRKQMDNINNFNEGGANVIENNE